MAAASYTTDLATQTDCSATTGFSEASGLTTTDGSGEVDPDLAIYGTTCVSESQRKTGAGSLFYTGTARTLPTDGAFFVWFKFFAPNSLDVKASGGIQVLIGQNSTNFRHYYVNGSDTYDYGGWVNYAADPRVTPSQTTNSPNTTYAGVGIGCEIVNGISKGNTYTIDHIRWGRGEIIITDGDLANGYANFDDAAVVNDNVTTGRWGLLQNQGGSYLWKGLLTLGTTGTSVDFRALNRVLTIQNTEFVSSAFNRIEVNNTASNIDWDAINISSLGTVSRGQFEMIDGATLDFDTCVFTDMDTFIFNKGAGKCDLLNSTWRRCRAVTQGGATITGSTFDNTDSAATESLISTSTTLGSVTGCSFVRTAGTVNAVAIGGLSGTINVDWDGNVLTGYGTGVTGNGISSTAGGAIKATFTGDGTLNINVVNSATTPTVEIVTGGNTVVVNVIAAVTVTISGLLGNTEISVLESPSPYSQTLAEQQAGAGPVSLFNTDFVSAVTGADIEIDTAGGANVTQILSSSTDFTNMTGLVAGNFVRVSERVTGSNLRTFDTFEVVSVATNTIVVENVASSTVIQQSLLDTTGATITIEKINATYSFALSSGTQVDILIFRVGSLPILLLEQIISATNNSFPLSQSLDRNFEV